MRGLARTLMTIPLLTALSMGDPPGGGHSSGGGGGGHSSGGVSVSAGRVSRTSKSFSGGPAISGPTPIGASGSAPIGAVGSLRPVFGVNGANRNAGVGRRGGRVPYGFYPGLFVAPFYGYDGYGGDYSDGGYGPGPYDGPGPGADQQATGDDPVNQQLQRLTADVQDLRDQQAQQQGAAMPGASGSVSQSGQADVQNTVPVTLVLRSGQQISVKKYPVTHGEFWDFSKQPPRKIPKSPIDVPAWEKATEANGGDFPAISE